MRGYLQRLGRGAVPWLLLASLVLWAIGMSLSARQNYVLDNSNPAPGDSMFFYILYVLPVLVAPVAAPAAVLAAGQPSEAEAQERQFTSFHHSPRVSRPTSGPACGERCGARGLYGATPPAGSTATKNSKNDWQPPTKPLVSPVKMRRRAEIVRRSD